MPATISSERPLDELVRQELGAKSLDLNWATFTFNPLSDFDLCVLSSYSPRKGTGTQYAFDDSGLHRLSPETAQRKSENGGAFPSARPSGQRSSFPLIISLAVNAVLVFAFLFRGGNGDGGKPTETPSRIEMTEAEAKAKWGIKWESEWGTAYRQKLRSSFEKRLGENSHIADFNREIVKIVPAYNNPNYPQERHAVGETLEVYVSFLEELFSQQQQNKER